MEAMYRIHTEGSSRIENIIQGNCYRFTVLTPCMVRLEYSEKGTFIDQPSQAVWYRSFPIVSFQCSDSDDSLRIETEKLIINYNKQRFSKDALSITVKNTEDNCFGTWHYGDEIHTLKGTVRTLDAIDGAVELEDGLLSREGFSVFDDSISYLIRDDGELVPRDNHGIDIYFLGYGHEYMTCLRDFFHLTGEPPLLPRYALGNWWSRFHRYTDEEYKELINSFNEKRIPLSIAVIDMDWHITEVEPKYGSGWTGYTWNRSLFPDPQKFMEWLHSKKLKVALNVHPADGVRAYEEAYPQMAEVMGVDAGKKEKVEFDCTSSKFLQAYFTYLHHPNERQGVDFWWVDWQQGESSKLPGLDPLWSLNHYHYLDNARNGCRPLILSRYAGVGSHRYPVGFSGDSIISWQSLQFQPYFTATASNVGYSWWSHDIGGHMLGTYDEELQLRWVQFGVFSPIFRLHCSGSIFNHKEPWNYSPETERIMKLYLRLRHKLIPYLYSMNYLTHRSGIPLINPMYYKHPEIEEAYRIPNEYYFGTEMICLPITEPVNPVTRTAKVEAWLPEGSYIDWMTGMIYNGNKRMTLYRTQEAMPVLLKAGAIVPCALPCEALNDISNPREMEITVCAGADGEFTLYEDDGISMDYRAGKMVETRFRLEYCDKSEFTIYKAAGDCELVPHERSYRIRFLGFTDPGKIIALKNGVREQVNFQYDDFRNEITMDGILLKTGEELIIRFEAGMKLGTNKILKRCFECLDRAWIAFEQKESVYRLLREGSDENIINRLSAQKLDKDLYGEIVEILSADKAENIGN